MPISLHSTRRPLTLIALMIAALFLAGAAPNVKNLVTNGDFERGTNKQDEPNGWHTRITGYTSTPEYEDPANKKGRTGVINFRCACGHEWGTTRPWTGLLCPKCKQMVVDLEESAGFYAKNFESVKLISRGNGKAVGVTMDGNVGGNQGVRVMSALMKAQRGGGYEMGFEALSDGKASIRVFLEGFRLVEDDEKATELLAKLPPECNPYKLTGRIKRVFRIHVNAEQPGRWTAFKEQGVPPKRSEFDLMLVNLYSYMPDAQAAFDNVFVRQLSQAEVDKFRKERGARDERFK